MIRNVKDYGARGDGITDDTAAIAAAAQAGGSALALYFPAGDYQVTSFPALPSYANVFGDGADLSTIIYSGNSTLITLQNKHRVAFRHVGIFLTGAQGCAVRLSNCFRCSFSNVIVRGNHTAGTYPNYLGTKGFVLEQNTGATTVINCDINNLGYGLVTSCIQNYVTNTKFATNRISVLGTGNSDDAGLSITGCDFVSGTNPNNTATHIDIDGRANNWWLDSVWFEGADIAVRVGRAGGGGPMRFGMVNCKVAARSVCLDLQHCHRPELSNITLDNDPGASPQPLRIDATYVPEGSANNVVTGFNGGTVDYRVFPSGWRTDAAHILRAADGSRWRLTVDTAGQLRTTRAS